MQVSASYALTVNTSKGNQDRYLNVWVRDKNGNEFPFFIPKADEARTRICTFVNESDYDYPKLVPHTSVTAQGLAGLATRRFQYGNTTGSEMYHMQNEKLKISKQTFLNWLKEGGEFIVGILPFIKRKLLTVSIQPLLCCNPRIDFRF